ncbi:MAG: hypothetical protein Q7U76_12160 [Nitrospirota bacterium]|nr:hypothetical protein [Nitrospirota bacterium]
MTDDDFTDLMSGKTNNPLAESEIPEILKRAINAGHQVLIQASSGKGSHTLIIDQSGNLQLTPLS